MLDRHVVSVVQRGKDYTRKSTWIHVIRDTTNHDAIQKMRLSRRRTNADPKKQRNGKRSHECARWRHCEALLERRKNQTLVFHKMAGHDSDDDASPDAVAKRLRDKIRLQAESLLSRCDNHPSSVSRSTSREFSRPSSFQDVRTVDTSSVVDASAAAVITPNGPEISPNSNHSVASNPSSANANTDLTKRIQRLALERQMRLDEDDAKNRLRIIQSDAASHLSSIKTFEELQLPKHLLNAVYTMGFNRPSAIQEAALPRIIAGRNVIGQAQSGSGKVRMSGPGSMNWNTLSHTFGIRRPRSPLACCIGSTPLVPPRKPCA